MLEVEISFLRSCRVVSGPPVCCAYSVLRRPGCGTGASALGKTDPRLLAKNDPRDEHDLKQGSRRRSGRTWKTQIWASAAAKYRTPGSAKSAAHRAVGNA